MKQYKLLNNAGKSVNTIMLEDDSDWVVPEGHRLELMGEMGAPASPGPPVPLSQLEFLRRFTAEERMAIRAAPDPVIVDFLHLLDLAQEVRLDDADTQAGVRHLESVGLLAAGRAEAILAPEQA